MVLGIKIENGDGTKQAAQVVNGGELLITNSNTPAPIAQKVKPFRQFLTDDGLSTGSNDMQVDGSVTPVQFWIPADDENDRYLTTLSFLIGDANMNLSLFGASAALTNGCKLFYTSVKGETLIADELQSNFDFVRLCLGEPAFGTGANAFIASKVTSAGASDNAIIPVLDLTKFLPPFGIKIDKGTTQKLILEVQDNTTGVDAFNVVASGFDRFE